MCIFALFHNMPRQLPGSGNRVNHAKSALKKYKQKSQAPDRKHDSRKYPRIKQKQTKWMREQDKLEDAAHQEPIYVFRFPLCVASIIAGYTEAAYEWNPFVKSVEVSVGGVQIDKVNMEDYFAPPLGYQWTDPSRGLWGIPADQLLTVDVFA